MACPHLDVRRRLLVGGVRSSGKAQAAARSIRAAAGEGNGRTGELLEPSLMPREAHPCRWVAGAGVKGLAAVERQAPAEHATRSGMSTAVPGV
jgi:hypothetical protein